MCIKYEPYLHQKSANWALNLVFYALMLMLLTSFVPNSTTRRCSFVFDANFALNLMQICTNSIKKVHNLHFCRKFINIRCQKVTGTKMHKCLVGWTIVIINNLKNFNFVQPWFIVCLSVCTLYNANIFICINNYEQSTEVICVFNIKQ